jgi:hypothetical protein
VAHLADRSGAHAKALHYMEAAFRLDPLCSEVRASPLVSICVYVFSPILISPSLGMESLRYSRFAVVGH